jgi:hypothetical protein
MPDQRPMLCYASASPTQPQSNWTWRGEMLFAIIVATMALLVILPFFDSPPGTSLRAHIVGAVKLHAFP